MTTINPQIDAAVPQMKARAAEFNETKTMDGAEVTWLLLDALRDFEDSHRAVWVAFTHREQLTPEAIMEVRKHIIDGMNRGALVLSVLPKAGE